MAAARINRRPIGDRGRARSRRDQIRVNPPRLSVVMPVHNALPFLEEALKSISGQSFSEFELVLFDDGSTDGSSAMLRTWQRTDPRVRLFESKKRLGPVGSARAAVAYSSAALIARMDADDVAHPDRLKQQIALIEKVPDLVLVGSLFQSIDREGRTVRPPDYGRLLRHSRFAPFPHSSVLFRREAYDRAGGYRDGTERWEDVDLYLRMAEVGRLGVIPEPLVAVRFSTASTRRKSGQAQFAASMDLMHRSIDKAGDDAHGKLRPETYVTTGSAALWAGDRGRVLVPLLKDGRLRADVGSAKALIWALWAEISPASLRFILRAALNLRNRSAARRLRGRAWAEWRPVGVQSAAESAGSFR
jgi:GT2 family glycosyltransferase